MDEIMQCPVCYSEYDTESRKPCIGKCGHSICFVCANDERCKTCPVCRRNGSFQEIVVNFGLMNIIEYRSKKKQNVEGICSLCTENEGIIYHLKNKEHNIRKLEIYAYNKNFKTLKMETKISVLYRSTSIVHKINVYIMGGEEVRNALKKVEVYNLKHKTRRKLADMTEARSNPSVCIHNGKIVVHGGYNNGYFVKSLEEYDFEKNEWKIIGKLNYDLLPYRLNDYYYRIVSHENDLYEIQKINRTITIKKFNKEKSVFEEVLSPTSVSLPMISDCTSFNGKIFIIDDGYSCNYNPSTNELSEEEDFEMMKELDARLYSLNNQLYSIDSESVEVFDQKNNDWNLLWNE